MGKNQSGGQLAKKKKSKINGIKITKIFALRGEFFNLILLHRYNATKTPLAFMNGIKRY